MSVRPSLFRDMANYLVGRGSLILLGFITFPLLTRLLSVDQFGVISLTLRLVLLLVVLSKCGLQYSAARFFNSTQTGGVEQRRFYSTLLICPAIISLIVSGFYVAAIYSSAVLRKDTLLFHCLLLAPAAVLLRTMQSMLLSFLRNEGRSRLHTILEVSTKITTVIAFTALAMAGQHKAFTVLLATIAGEFLMVAVQIGDVLRRGLIHPSVIDWHFIRLSLTFGLPLIAYELSSLVLDSADRLIVQHYMGDHSLGLYSAAYGISGYLQDVIMTPLNLALFPIYMRLWNQQGKEATAHFLSKALSWFLVVAFFIVGASTLCSRDTLLLLASRRFAGSENLLLLLVPGLMIYALHIFFNVGLILQKRTKLLAAIVMAAASINIAANCLWIPRFGLMGAAAATVLSYVAMVAALVVANRTILPLRLNLALAFSGLAAMFCAYPLPNLIRTSWLVTELVARAAMYTVLFVAFLSVASREFRNAARQMLARLPMRFVPTLRVGPSAVTAMEVRNDS